MKVKAMSTLVREMAGTAGLLQEFNKFGNTVNDNRYSNSYV